MLTPSESKDIQTKLIYEFNKKLTGRFGQELMHNYNSLHIVAAILLDLFAVGWIVAVWYLLYHPPFFRLLFHQQIRINNFKIFFSRIRTF